MTPPKPKQKTWNPYVLMAAVFAIGTVFGAFVFELAILAVEILWKAQWIHFAPH